MSREFRRSAGLYMLLLAGGLWHLLEVLQAAMRVLAAPMIMTIGLLLVDEHRRSLAGVESLTGTRHRPPTGRLLWWGAAVFATGFLVELAGVKTGMIFGVYSYGQVLQPTLLGVPLAIGFAWLVMVISSAAVAQRLLPAAPKPAPVRQAMVIAGLMVIFDFFMEPAAMHLGYWEWPAGQVPARNYLAWFVVGFLLAHAGARLQLFERRLSPVAVHAYVAQLVYFIMVNLS